LAAVLWYAKARRKLLPLDCLFILPYHLK
jgi:hypothetical protein